MPVDVAKAVFEVAEHPGQVGIADLVFATMKAVGAEMYRFPMGWNWYIVNFYVPMIMVSHVMIVRYLLPGRRVERM